MRTFLAGLGLAVGLGAAGPGLAQEAGLERFGSEDELKVWLSVHALQDPPVCDNPDPMMCAMPEDDGGEDEVEEMVVVTGSRISAPDLASTSPIMAVGEAASDESITNNQELGVDEGDIVKLRGNTLIVLRRGRLFTIDISGGGLRAVDQADAYPPGFPVDPGSWYDEMLVSGDWIVVIGYLYDGAVTGTQINRFQLDAAGNISFVDSHHIATDDYYSSTNYASRMLGDDLILYTPAYVDADDPLADLPTLARWAGKDQEAQARPLVGVRDIYRAPESLGEVEAIHAVTRCELTAPELTCRSTAVIGPGARTFYASADAGYLWLSGWRARSDENLPESAVYRLPFGEGRPRALQVRGAPVDQFSLEEDAANNRLYALVLSDSHGDAMWNPWFADGAAALVTLDLSRFGDGSGQARDQDYRLLPPMPENSSGGVRNRFVGRHLFYGVGVRDEEWEPLGGVLHVVPLDQGGIQTHVLDGGVVRIEPMGRDALILTENDEGLSFRSFNLTPTGLSRRPDFSNTYLLEDAGQAEYRSHAFFYRPDPGSPDGEAGLLGLPVFEQGGGNRFSQVDASVVFLRRFNDRLTRLGDLHGWADPEDDMCEASCVDWYGDARPIFIGDRIFGLLGYELVEGQVRNGHLYSVRRVDFAPRLAVKD